MIFNPFDVCKLPDEILVEQIKNSINKCNDEADSVAGMSENLMNLTDVLYIYGELLTRAQRDYSLLKYQNNTEEIQLAGKLKKESTEKQTATYFNAMAQQLMLEKRTKEFDLQQNVTRLKYAYDATQEKINAIKKKMDASKYEFSMY